MKINMNTVLPIHSPVNNINELIYVYILSFYKIKVLLLRFCTSWIGFKNIMAKTVGIVR